MGKRSEKLRAANAVANILNWYRNYVSDTEQEIEEGIEVNNDYPNYSKEDLVDEWKFWAGAEPDVTNINEVSLYKNLWGVISILNQMEGL